MSPSALSAHRLDRAMKWLPCLSCGRQMWTDRCHRICKKCRRRHNASPDKPAHHVSLPREWCAVDGAAHRTVFDY
ncbi:MAG TPA: hypothetical protein PLE19_18880 [Planctomycetota bacterium]|nr:hypothetical protein [Planctomycetota bacterium]HRR81126.1 hypothetical protein [Planctomycetota bacterium]HRT96103.1 hypothetical protein [Planctomycetota bacterium]